MGRRDFLSLAGRGALWATLGASVVALVRFLSFTEPELPARFTLERADVYPIGALTPVAEGRAFIGRDTQGLYAVIAACTHLGCRVTREEQALACPCHGSRFDTSGVVLQGPAARPLARAALTLGLEGRVELDLGQIVDAEYRLPLPSPFQQETPT
ncbi:MAG TPA: Rieske 2Fe-2S domain-containing protein [Anaerolineae bacterium]|nr:Rieske 2Fe-2S domain-containing protein [Anaerolineae bacterium]